MNHEVTQQALNYLQQHQVMTLATVGPDGVWAAAVFYVTQQFDLFFLSAGQTRHAQNMAASPRVAATIQEDYADWKVIQGIQLEGNVEILHGVARQTAMIRYLEKYPFLSQAPLPIQTAMSKVNWYRLRPERLYLVDNKKGFGHRDEIQLP